MASRLAKKSPSYQNALWMARGREVLVPDGVYDHFAAGVGARGANARRRMDEALSIHIKLLP